MPCERPRSRLGQPCKGRLAAQRRFACVHWLRLPSRMAQPFERRGKARSDSGGCPLISAVVRRFLGDLHIVHVAFADTGGGDLDELGLVVHLFDRGATAVAHGGAHAARHLVDDADHGALVGHTAFDAFGHELVSVGVAGARLLEVAVGTALLHGANGAHAAVALVAAALEQDDFAGRFFGACKHATHHHRAGASGQGLGDVAAVADTAVRDQRHACALEGRGDVVDGHDLGHAHTGHDAGGADGARADTDLDGIRARLDQRQGRRAGGDVAADHVDLRVVLLDPAHAVDHALAVAVGRVHHDSVHTGFDQGFDAFFGALAHTYRCAYAQAACGIAGRIGEAGLFGDVLHRDQALELKGVVHDQDAFELVLVEQRLGFGRRGALFFIDRDELLARGHDLVDLDVVTGLKAQVAAGDDPHHLAAVAHGKA